MILAGVFLVITMVLAAISYALGLITFIMPEQFNEAITYFTSFIHYGDFLVPVATLLEAFGVYLTFIFAFYSLKILLWIFSHLPFTKSGHDLPHMADEGTDVTSVNRRLQRKNTRALLKK